MKIFGNSKKLLKVSPSLVLRATSYNDGHCVDQGRACRHVAVNIMLDLCVGVFCMTKSFVGYFCRSNQIWFKSLSHSTVEV